MIRLIYFRFLPFLVALSFQGCYKEIVYESNPFLRKELNYRTLEANNSLLYIGSNTTVSANATGDSLTFEWFSNLGTIEPNGKTALFTSNEPGVATITCTITDVYNNSETKSINITITFELSFLNITATDTIFPTNWPTNLKANASGDQIAFTWWSSSGQIDGIGDKIVFIAQNSGEHTVWCKVSDINGNELTQQIQLIAQNLFVFKKLQADRYQMKPQENIEIEAIVLGRDVEYSWRTYPQANILGSGSKVIFTICHSDTYQVECSVFDRLGNTIKKTVTIYVRD